MRYEVIAFDLDGTLAESKSRITPEMGNLLDHLGQYYQVVVISGGKKAQFEKQLLPYLTFPPHLMPTCGACYYKHDPVKGWREVYKLELSKEDKDQIFQAFETALAVTEMEFPQLYGEQIEDRGTQITFSALGQKAPVKLKEQWDPNQQKRLRIIAELKRHIPQFEIRYGGTTSIDVTHKGIDKSFGMKKLMEDLNINREDIFFVGDALQPGGNDYAVKEMGIKTREVSGPEETEEVIRSLIQLRLPDYEI